MEDPRPEDGVSHRSSLDIARARSGVGSPRVLRVDRFFRTSGSAVERRVYEVGRASVERVNSRLEFVGLECLKLRGLRNVLVHVLLCIVVMLVVAVAAVRLGRPWKVRSLASFWW